MADLAQLQTWLTEAQNARHQIAMGQAVVEVWRDGRRMTYSKTSLSDLNDYVADLERQIRDAQDAAAGTTTNRRRSIGVVFGG